MVEDKFNLDGNAIAKADMHDYKKMKYVCDFLTTFFQKRKNVLIDVACVDCFEHKLEMFEISDKMHTSMPGFCFEKTFAGWENTFTIYWDSKFKCKQIFPIGFHFKFRIEDLPRVINQLSDLSDMEFIQGHNIDEKNALSIFTGHRQYLYKGMML